MQRSVAEKSLKIFLISIFVIIIAFYAYDRSKNLIFGPQITIEYPQNGVALEDDLISIRGVIKNAKEIKLNNRQIFTNEKDRFNEDILLSYGYNIIELTATDKFGKTHKKVLQLVYK